MLGAKKIEGTSARSGWVIACAILVVFSGASIRAFETKGRVGDVAYHVIAPDWTWVGESFNVLVVLESENPARARLNLWFDAEVFDVPGLEPGLTESGERFWRGEVDGIVRFAFKRLVARELRDQAPRFRLAVADVPGDVAVVETIEFSIETIRGPVVARTDEGTDWWSIGVLVGVSGLAIPAFLIFVRRYGRRGAWRTPDDARIPDAEERWWIETP